MQKRKVTDCSFCRHHSNCDEERKIAGHGRIVYCFYFCKPAGRIEKCATRRFGSGNIIAGIVSFLMTRLFPANAERVAGKRRISVESAKASCFEKK